MEISVTSKSILTALPEVATTIGETDGISSAMSTIGMTSRMGLGSRQCCKQYDTFAQTIQLQEHLLLLQVSNLTSFVSLLRRSKL